MTDLPADHVSRIVLGLHAAILAAVHGAFTLAQGPSKGAGPGLISAIGPPCAPESAWHACLPAFTLAPDLRVAGVLTLTVALLTALAALLLAGRRAAMALAAFVLWGLGGWWLGGVANDALVWLGGATFLLDLALPVAVVVSARARVAWARRP